MTELRSIWCLLDYNDDQILYNLHLNYFYDFFTNRLRETEIFLISKQFSNFLKTFLVFLSSVEIHKFLTI